MSRSDAEKNVELVRKCPEMCEMTLGVHPYHPSELYDGESSEDDSNSHLKSLQELGEALMAEKVSPLVAFGEIGLDYVYLDRADKARQQQAFRDQLKLATKFQLPFLVHVRESTEDFISIVKPYLSRLPRRGLVHSFAGSKDEMLKLAELGLDISVNGILFRTDEQLDMVKHIPLERLQLETDAPWCEVFSTDAKTAPYLAAARALPPSRKHNKFVLGQIVKTQNESCTIERVALVVAGLNGKFVDEVAEVALACFGGTYCLGAIEL